MPSRCVVSALLLAALLSQVAAQTVVHEAGEPGLEPPRLIEDSRVHPIYPEEALRDGVQGTVLLRLVVTEYGLVGNVEIFRSPFGGEALAQAALEAVRQWRYHPAQLQGRDVSCRIMQTIPFYPAQTKPPEKRSRRARRSKKEPAPKPVPPAPEAKPPVAAEPSPPTPADPQPPAPAEPSPPAPADPLPTSRPSAEPEPGVKPLPPPEAKPAGPVPEPAQASQPASSRKPPIARPVASPAIDIGVGGPRGILLGQPGEKVRALPEAAGQDSADVLRLAELGMEITLADSPRGEHIVAIRYVFAPGGELPVSGLRTRKGLGHGSFCMGIVPAYGRPDERRESTQEDGSELLSLEYRNDRARSWFVCRDGRLAELILEQVPQP